MKARAGTVTAPDGTRIAYEVEGEGPPMVLTNGLTTTRFFWKYLLPRWRERYTVITWEYPGHGSSEPARSAQSATIEGQPILLARVLDAVGVERAVQIGWSVGCQVVFELYRQYPERCSALVSLFGPAERALTSTSLPVPGPVIQRALADTRGTAFAALFQKVATLAKLPGGAALLKRSGVIGRGTSHDDVRALIADMQRVHPATGAQMARSAEQHSARDLLGSIRVPVLVMGGDKDRFAPADRIGAAIHAAIPGSEFVRLPEGTHTALLDHVEEIGAAIEAFLTRIERA